MVSATAPAMMSATTSATMSAMASAMVSALLSAKVSAMVSALLSAKMSDASNGIGGRYRASMMVSYRRRCRRQYRR